MHKYSVSISISPKGISSANIISSVDIKSNSSSDNLLNLRLSSSGSSGNTYTCKVLELSFYKDSISSIRVVKDIDLGKWCANHYDFVYEEYDRTLHVEDLENSSDFKKIKSKYFKHNASTALKKAKAEEYFDAGVGDKDSLGVSHTVSSELNLECKKENLKELESRINSLLVLV